MENLSGSQTDLEASGQPKADSSLAYRWLLFYLMMLFLRPYDLIPALKVLHLPMVSGGLCFVIYIWSSYSTGRTVFPLTPTTKMLAVMTGWAMLTIPFSFWISGSFTAFWNDWVKMVVLFLMLGNVLQSARNVQGALWMCIVSATCISSLAIALKILLGESVAEGRLVSDASGVYSGPNFFSMTLILFLPYVIFFFFLHKKWWVRLFSGLAIAAFTIANMLTESRAGTIGEALVVIMAFWNLRRWGVSLTKTFGILVLGAILFLPFAPKGLWERFSTLFVSSDVAMDPNSTSGSALGSKRQREELLVRAVILTAENPILGVGMNNFAAAAHERFNTTAEDWVGCHDTFLQISSELGIPGLLFYVGLLWAAWKTVRFPGKQMSPEDAELPENRDFRILSDATVISFIGYVLFSTLAHLGYQPYFFVVAGIGESLRHIYLRSVEPAAVELSVTSLAVSR
jgi:O-antigen ligase